MFTALDNNFLQKAVRILQIIAIHLPYVLELTSVWLSCDSNNDDDVYGAVIVASHCESSPGPLDECRLSARWPPTLKPVEPIWVVNPLVGYYDPHSSSPFIIYSTWKPILRWYLNLDLLTSQSGMLLWDHRGLHTDVEFCILAAVDSWHWEGQSVTFHDPG